MSTQILPQEQYGEEEEIGKEYFIFFSVSSLEADLALVFGHDQESNRIGFSYQGDL